MENILNHILGECLKIGKKQEVKEEKMQSGTSYFVSKEAAVKYYKGQDYDDAEVAVEQKLKDGEIHIGKPELKDGETLKVNKEEGRYFIEADRKKNESKVNERYGIPYRNDKGHKITSDGRVRPDSKMTRTPVKTAEEARQKAIDWQVWQSEQSMSQAEVIEWERYFSELAKQFGLEDEFRENGIIGESKKPVEEMAMRRKTSYSNDDGFEFDIEPIEHTIMVKEVPDGYKVGYLTQDKNASSPNEMGDDGIAFLVHYHRQFWIDNKNVTENDLRDLYTGNVDDNERVEELQAEYHIFPVKAYIHSGVRLSLGRGGFGHDPGGWDTSHVGAVFVNKKETPDQKSAEEIASGLVDEWNQYLEGDVYGIIINKYDKEKNFVDQLEAVWGFYGEDGAKEELASMMESTNESRKAKGGKRLNEKHVAFDVFLVDPETGEEEEIDTVFYSDTANVDEEEVKKSLVDHDGYDPNIIVRKAVGEYRRSRKAGKKITEAGDDMEGELNDGEPKPSDNEVEKEKPESKEPEAPQKGEDKEYFGRSGDEFYYLVKDGGKYTVVNAVDKVAEKQSEEYSDVVDFIVHAVQELKITEVSFSIIVNYILPKLEQQANPEPQEEEEEELETKPEREQKDNEGEDAEKEEAKESVRKTVRVGGKSFQVVAEKIDGAIKIIIEGKEHFIRDSFLKNYCSEKEFGAIVEKMSATLIKQQIKENKALSVTINVPTKDAKEMQSILNRSSAIDTVKQGEVIKTFTAKFNNGYEADIKVVNGNEDSSPYVDPVLFNASGNEIAVGEVADSLLGEYIFDYDGQQYTVIVK